MGNSVTVCNDSSSVVVSEKKITAVVANSRKTSVVGGLQGIAGLSPYQLAVKNGFVGTESQWLISLIGQTGATGAKGDTGAAGDNGLSAYQVALANGFVGTESHWLISLIGAPGENGLPILTTDAAVATPAAGKIEVISISEAIARDVLATIDSAGHVSKYQDDLSQYGVGWLAPTVNLNAITPSGCFPSINITGYQQKIWSATNLYTRSCGLTFYTNSFAGNVCGIRALSAFLTLSNGTIGGFLVKTRFTISDYAGYISQSRFFLGISATTGAFSNVSPASLINSIGIGCDVGDTNLHLYRGGISAQVPYDLGSNFPCNTNATDIYELVLYAPEIEANIVYWQVTRINTGHKATGFFTAATQGTELPLPSLGLVPLRAWRLSTVDTGNVNNYAGFTLHSAYMRVKI